MKFFNNEKNELTGIFFQDSIMKCVFQGYPEVLMIDATYKLNKFRMPLYVLLAIDGNGLSEIVGIFLTSVENEDAITRMVSTFKSFNSSWEKTKVVLSDKDFTERNVFEKEFPMASLIICLFHTMRSFRREISCEKLSLRSGERD